MQDTDSSRAFQIKDASAAKAVSDPFKRRLLLACALKPISIKNLSDLLSTPLPKTHYNVQTLLKLGLVEIVEVQKRAGREIKLYQAISRVFFVPSYLGEHMSAPLRTEQKIALENHRVKSGAGFEFQMSRTGKMVYREIQEEKFTPGAIETWAIAHLTEEENKILHEKMLKLTKKYMDKGAKLNSKPYLIRIAITKRPGN